ncbi:DUF3267 domain-containing protein [Eggerthella timonensis]|uniref:DUF3267 domain-containing protein n=1 Tax=Eggerthella timonensis TaxID=1871008 RepID=UPI000C76D182|nr:DUF3267 domain-containing protein [Eggerthella timonensis]
MADQERKLTKAELARKEAFERAKADFEAQGFRTQPLTLSVVSANVQALVLGLPLAVVLGAGFFLLHPTLSFSFDLVGTLLVLAAFFALVVLHELIHGIAWSACAKGGWKSVSFGVIWQYLTPYCTCDEPLSKRAYVVDALAPTVVLGPLLVIAAYASGSAAVLAVGLLMILEEGAAWSSRSRCCASSPAARCASPTTLSNAASRRSFGDDPATTLKTPLRRGARPRAWRASQPLERSFHHGILIVHQLRRELPPGRRLLRARVRFGSARAHDVQRDAARPNLCRLRG